jgi:dihydroorotate dehydrogenase
LRANLPSSIPIIGCGGISTGKDALDYAKAGASLVQVYTSFGYDGIGACRRIKDELVDELAKEGKTWAQVSKEAVERLSWKEPPPETRDVLQLVREAEELKELLETLGDKMEAEAAAVAVVSAPIE